MTCHCTPLAAMDTYSIYAQWFADHYGRPFTVTREQFESWCRRPSSNDYRDADQREFDREREEGWTYDEGIA